jgi:hypothetical protein
MKRIDKNIFGPWAIVTGASSGIGQEFAPTGASRFQSGPGRSPVAPLRGIGRSA